jgi:hypothetical protein
MEYLKDYLELPVFENPYEHEYLMSCTSYCAVEIIISKGKYIITFDEPIEIYKLGSMMASFCQREFKTTNALPNPFYKKK